MAQHPPQPGELAVRDCTDCGTTVALGDARSAAPEPVPSACTIANRRPRNLAQYQAACAATDGEVVELDVAAAQPGMTVWHIGGWRVLTHVVLDGGTVELHMAVPDGIATRYASINTPLYRLS